jgi:hypothetical protein
MYVKVTEREGKKVVAACDRELLGKVFSEGDAVLDLETYAPFYRGERTDAGGLAESLGGFDSANLVGKKSVNVALENGLAQKRDVKYINGIPHLQIYRI